MTYLLIILSGLTVLVWILMTLALMKRAGASLFERHPVPWRLEPRLTSTWCIKDANGEIVIPDAIGFDTPEFIDMVNTYGRRFK